MFQPSGICTCIPRGSGSTDGVLTVVAYFVNADLKMAGLRVCVCSRITPDRLRTNASPSKSGEMIWVGAESG